MKIAILSDIHLDMNTAYVGENLFDIFVQCLKDKAPDLILIAGDLSDHVSSTLKIIERVEQLLGIKVLFVPGNHDIWSKKNESSLYNYELFATHASSLINRPYLLPNDYVIIGEMGWFDYTFAAPYITVRQIQKELQHWGDHKYTNWGCNHIALNERFLAQAEKQLLHYPDKKIIFASHFVPYKEFLIPSNSYMDWDLYNAFMGSSKLGELLDRHQHIEYLVFGHTHERYGTTSFRKKKVICNPLGYIGERSKLFFQKELEQSITMIEI